MCLVGGSPLVAIDIWVNNWCWHAGTDKEVHLSPVMLLMELILGMPACIELGFSILLTIHYPHNLGPSITELCIDHMYICGFDCQIHVCLIC